MTRQNIAIGDFVTLIGRDLRFTPLGSDLEGIEGIEVMILHDDVAKRRLQLICASRTDQQLRLAGIDHSASQLRWHKGSYQRDDRGNYLGVSGQDTTLQAILHLPTPLSADARGYWLVFKCSRDHADKWQVDLAAASASYPSKYHSSDGKGGWLAAPIADRMAVGRGAMPLGHWMAQWAFHDDVIWSTQAQKASHPLFDQTAAGLLQSRVKANFGLRLDLVTSDPGREVREVQAHYLPFVNPMDGNDLTPNQDGEEVRELAFAALTGAGSEVFQPFQMFHVGGASMLAVIDQNDSDPRRNAFLIEWRQVAAQGDAASSLCVRSLWALIARHYTLGLASARARNRLSFFPDDLQFGAAGGDWALRFRIQRNSTGKAWSVRLVEIVAPPRSAALTCTMSLAGAIDRNGKPVACHCVLDTNDANPLWQAGLPREPDVPPRPLLRLQGSAPSGPQPLHLEMVVGAARMTLDRLAKVTLEVFSLSPLYSYAQAPIEAQVALAYEGAMLRPASQDPEIGFETLSAWETRERPITIDLAMPDSSVNYEIDESMQRDQSRILRIGVVPRQAQDLAPIDTIVIDPAPLLIARVRVSPAAGGQPQQKVLLAEYTDDAEQFSEWTFHNTSGEVALTLPPQAIGEEMIKGRLTHPALGEVPPAGHLLDFRLSPAAQLAIDLSDIDIARPSAPWAMRRLLNHRSGVVGLKTGSASFELLYGLTTKVETPGLRIAETDAFIGRVPFSDDLLKLYRASRSAQSPGAGALPAQTATQARQQHYASHVARWTSQLFYRPAQLTMFREFTDRTRLVLEEGVSFHQRASRLTANPFHLEQFASQAAADPRPPLRGGADLMFESPALADEFWGAPSGTGTVTGLRFGPLGGTGEQHAQFNNGKTQIISSSTDGRLNSLTLIRIGRIAMLWHRARHVIVYERSTRTAPRYQRKGGEQADQPDGFEGLAVLRKVREYVEITQPRRLYPDSSTALPINGPLLAATFDTVIIPVKPDWGRDIEDGWITPLRGPLAPEEEVYYPWPNIFAELARADAKGGGHLSQQFADPSQLYFFTSTSAKDKGDSDSWPAWPGVDYPLTGRPRATDSSFRPRLGNTKQPDAARHDLGQRRYTLDLVAAEEAVNLMHGRPFDGIEAKLTNVCLARGLPPVDILKNKQVIPITVSFCQGHLAVSEGLDDVLHRLRTLGASAGQDVMPSKVQSAARDLLAEVRGKLASAPLQQLNTDHNANPDNWISRQQGMLRHAQAAEAHLLGTGGQWQQQLDALIGGLGKLTPEHLEQGRHSLLDALETVCRQAEERISGAPSVPQLALDSVHKLLDSVEARLKEWQQQQRGKVLALIDQLEGAARGIDHWPVQAKLALNDQYDRVYTAANQLKDGLVQSALAGLGEWFAGALFDTAASKLPAVGKLREACDDLLVCVESWTDDCARLLERPGAPDYAYLRRLTRQFELPSSLFDEVRSWLDELAGECMPALDLARDKGRAALHASCTAVTGKIHALGTLAELQACGPTLAAFVAEAGGTIAGVHQALGQVLDALTANTLWPKVVDVAQDFNAMQAAAVKQLQALEDAIAHSGDDAVRDVLKQVEGLAQPLQEHMQALAGQVETAVASQLGEWRTQAESMRDSALEMTRALAGGPITDTIEATRQQLGYYFDPALAQLDVSKTSAIFNRAGSDVLNALGVEMPFDRIRDRLLPDLSGCMLHQLLPSFGGLDLSFLLAALGIETEGAREYGWLNMRHGFDQDRLRAWADVRIDKRFAQRTELFSLPPFSMQLERTHFDAYSRMEAGSDGAQVQSTSATLTADWILELSGKTLLTITHGKLHYDSGGGFNFDMDIDALSLDESLQFLTDALKAMRPNDSGVTITPILPGGVSASMDLPLPDIGTGAFTLTSLALFLHFDLLFAPKFELRTGLWLARPERPFGLAILFLGGGGWFGVDLAYQPPDRFVTRVSIGISAGAFAALNFGVATGSAGLLFTAGLDFYNASGKGGGSATSISIGLLMWGEFSICCIASAYLRLVMRVTQAKGGMTGYGQIEVRIKICWCFTLRVSSPIAMPFKRSEQAGSTARPAIAAARAAPPPKKTVADAVSAHFANLDC